jgi:hypothetical protein
MSAPLIAKRQECPPAARAKFHCERLPAEERGAQLELAPPQQLGGPQISLRYFTNSISLGRQVLVKKGSVGL